MKKLLFSLVICTLFLSSCVSNEAKTCIKGMYGSINAIGFNYNNHSYIEFKDDGVQGHSIIHDPDCLMKDIDSIMQKNKINY